jgi:hypothetical protein
MSEGVRRIAEERQRQIEKEGWTAEHDAKHTSGDLALAACCYASPVPLFVEDRRVMAVLYVDPWPWDPECDRRPKDGNRLRPPTEEEHLRGLVKAGALVAAEIDRIFAAREAATRVRSAECTLFDAWLDAETQRRSEP